MAVVRVPRFLVLPICAIGGAVWVGQGIASFTAKPTVTLYAGDSDVKVEVLDAKQKVEASAELRAGERYTFTTSRGKHTVRSTKLDGTKHESSVKLGFADKYAVPTNSDQCFALIDISAWYGARYKHQVDVTDARIEKRIFGSGPFEFPDDTYGTLRETPAKVDYKDHPKLVTAVACSKLTAATDAEILATLERRLTVSSTTLTSLALPKSAEKTEKTSGATGRDGFTRRMSEQKPDWMRVYEDDSMLAYRSKSGDFIVVDAHEIPENDPASLAAYVANIEDPQTKGTYRKTDLLPSLAIHPKKNEDALEIGAERAGFVLRRTDAKGDHVIPSAALTAIGGDMRAIALENAQKRYGAKAEKCVAKLSGKFTTCATEKTELTGVLLSLRESKKVTGKVWMRVNVDGLTLRKAGKKAPPSADVLTTELTLEKNELAPGLS